MSMRRVVDPAGEVRWLADRDGIGAVTGYDQQGWHASTWVLHAMYHNSGLDGLGSHHDHYRRRLASGEASPAIIGQVNLDEVSTVTGMPLGFTVRPGAPWRRLLWRDHLGWGDGPCPPDQAFPPSYRWFPHRSWPLSFEPPAEGSLDEASLEALVAVLAEHSSRGRDTRCVVFYCALAAGDFDTPHVWEGPLAAVGDLIENRGGTYPSSPTNFWPRDRSWFVWTDWDLSATKVSGTGTLIEAIKSSNRLETIDWPLTRRDQDPAAGSASRPP
ncbi:hypothetical protein ORV05_02130 [Amycolatopsis cynarae]|uniref:DUF317 domain-containing protein n=1 Tax=Amycolatopsis cynarae TaxID=2995223 RepID=A0ABY7B5W4_9PSEU|nr:hypothetical protein [Amycolatopsis sp. HUAS 11-8]WAL66637.1 hypothetical protein ORV05_02130 [Amycolatopsis sp. HUAS 11-8]